MTNNSSQDPFSSIPISAPDQGAEELDFKVERPDSPPSFSRARTPRKTPFSKKKIFLTALMLLLVSYFSGGFFLVPYLVTHQGARLLADRLQRPVTIGEAAFNPATLQITLKNAIIGPQFANPDDPVDPLLSLSSLDIDLQWASLFHRAIICQEFSLQQLFIHIVRNHDNSTNLKDLFTAPDTTTALSRFMPPFFKRYSFSNIQLESGEILFEDLPTGARHRVTDISLALPALATVPLQSPRLKPRFSAMVNGSLVALTNGKTMTSGTAVTAQLSLNMKDISLAEYAQYLPSRYRFKEVQGTGSITADLQYNSAATTPAEQLRITGTIEAETVTVHDSDDTLSTIQSLRLSGWYAPLTAATSINELTVQSPRFHIQQTNGTTFHSPVLIFFRDTLALQENTSSRPHITLTDGSLSHFDHRTKKETLWQNIQLTIAPPEEKGETQGTLTASLSGRGPDGTSINCQGTMTTSPFSLQGFLVGNHLDAALLLSWVQGVTHPDLQGDIDQLQAEFSFARTKEKSALALDKVMVQARNLVIEEENNLTRIALWQSKNGSYHSERHSIDLGAIEMEKALLTLQRPAGQQKWSPLLPRFAEQPESLAIHFQSLEMRQSQLTIDDKGANPALHFTLENVTLQAALAAPGRPATFTSSATILAEAAVQASGSFKLSPFAAEISLTIEALPLQSLLQTVEPPRRLNGLLSARGRLALPEITFQGDLELTEFQMNTAQTALKWQKAASTGITLRRLPFLLKTAVLSITQPELSMTVSKAEDSFLQQLWLLLGTSPFPAKQASLEIDQVRFINGSAHYKETTTGKPFSMTLAGVTGTAAPFALPTAQPVSVALTGTIHPTAAITLESSLEISGNKPLSLYTTLSNLDLSAYRAQLEPVLGYTIINGIVNIANTSGKNSSPGPTLLSINKLQLGHPITPNESAVRGWQSIPLLQALMTDTEGRLELMVPAPSDQPGPADMAAFTTHLRRELLKATVSPNSFLAEQLNSDHLPEHLSFAAGETTLTDDHKTILRRLAKALGKRPLLKIVLIGSANQNDFNYLKEKRIDEIDRRLRQHESRLSENLSSAYGNEEIGKPQQKEASRAELLASRQNITIADSLLNRLAAQRLTNVHDFLLDQGVAEKRVTTTNKGYTRSAAGREDARVDLKIE